MRYNHLPLFPMTLQDGIAELNQLMTVGNRRIKWASHYVDVVIDLVERAEAAFEGVRATFDVSCGEGGEVPGRLGEQRRVADQRFVGLAAMANPDLVGCLAVPGQGTLRTGNLVAEAVLPASRYL